MKTTARTQPVDMIAELRLRQWARRNYVPLDIRRDEEWHPIVLDEMRRKDIDLRLQESVTEDEFESDIAPTGFVPLMPTFRDNTRLDANHPPVPVPQFLHNPAASEMLIPYYV